MLDTYDPLFETPTTATIVGDSLFLIANPQLDKMLNTHPAPPRDSLHDLHLVKLLLK